MSSPCRALDHIAEIDTLGGMAKAIEDGLPKLRIEEAAARTQARIDSGRQTLVGVNRYRPDEERDIDILRVDNSAVLAAQIAKLKRLRAERDETATQAALAALTDAARNGTRQPARACDRRGAGQGDRRRDERRAGGCLRPLRAAHPGDQRHLRTRKRRRRGRGRRRAGCSRPSPRATAGRPASSSPRSARTVTTAGRR